MICPKYESICPLYDWICQIILQEFGTHFLRNLFDKIMCPLIYVTPLSVPCVPHFSQNKYNSLGQVMEKVIPGKCLKLC